MVYPQSLLFSSSVIEKIFFDDKTMSLKFFKSDKIYQYEIDEHFLNEIILTECSVGEVFNRYKPSLNLI